VLPWLQFDKCAADATEYKAGYDKLLVDNFEQKAQLDKAAADASEFKAGYDRLLVDNAEQQAHLDKAAADATEFKAGYDKLLVDTSEQKAQLDKAAADATEYKAGYDKLLVDTSEQKAQVRSFYMLASRDSSMTTWGLQHSFLDSSKRPCRVAPFQGWPCCRLMVQTELQTLLGTAGYGIVMYTLWSVTK